MRSLEEETTQLLITVNDLFVGFVITTDDRLRRKLLEGVHHERHVLVRRTKRVTTNEANSLHTFTGGRTTEHLL